MTLPSGISAQDLHDYVDGRLDAADRARVARYLAANPEDAAEIESYRAQAAGLHALYDGALDEAVPPAMAAVLRRHRGAARRRWAARAAVLILCVAAAGAAGWWLRGAVLAVDPTLQRFVVAAEQNYERYAAAGAGVDEAAAQPSGALAPIIGRRIGAPVVLPELEKAGYALSALHFVPTADGDAAMLVFRDPAGRTAALFVVRVATPDQPPQLAARGPIATVYRVRHGVGYALTLRTADLDDRLQAVLAGG